MLLLLVLFRLVASSDHHGRILPSCRTGEENRNGLCICDAPGYGKINARLTYRGVKKDGVDGVDGLKLANSVAVSPDGKHVYVTGRDDSAVAWFSRNADTGALTYLDAIKEGDDGVVDGLYQANSATVSRDGKSKPTSSL